MKQIARHIVFIGRVQGVGFRFTVLNVANHCQLTGQVRNLIDGSVEMIAQGPPEDIDDCIQQINDVYQGSVKETKINEVPFNAQYEDFKITF